MSEDVTVAGWWGSRRPDEPGAESVFSWLVRGSMPFGSWNEGPEQLLFVDDVDVAPPEGWPDGIHWATITGRRGSSKDLACHVDRPIVGSAPLHCPAYLVASAVLESEPPDSALSACSAMPFSDGGWVDVEAFTGYPPACFGSRDMTVRGWFDIRYIIAGWEAPWGISPGWLWVPIGPWTVVSPGSNAEAPSALLVYVDPASAVDASSTNRWVLLTGHYADRAAASCRIEYAGGYDPAVYPYRVPDSFARRECEAHFVATSVQDTAP